MSPPTTGRFSFSNRILRPINRLRFATEIGVIALGRLLAGGGYDSGVFLIQEAFSHLTEAASRFGARDWAKAQVRALVDGPCDASRKHFQSVLAQCLARFSEEAVRD